MVEYQKVGLGYPDSAPVSMEFVADLPISAEALFACFKSPDTWAWATISRVEWETPEPFGEGTTRTVHTANGRVQEHFFLWDSPRRMAFRFENGDISLLNAFVEDYCVEDSCVEGTGDSCRLTWRIGLEFRGLFKLLTPVLKIIMRRQFETLRNNLVAYITHDYKPPQSEQLIEASD
jgi:hypothetical protein